jgi:hypothetical protein
MIGTLNRKVSGRYSGPETTQLRFGRATRKKVSAKTANGFAVSPDRSTLAYSAAKSDEADLISLELKKESFSSLW